ncbi:MAG TPA: epoxide hydrolase N-terminal domain-containing protein, partial [Dehalococcoidia bacterium]|nr:epoxide hydrolase N-terminal domain-containing protein [Dehalococcoidia bacterium]
MPPRSFKINVPQFIIDDLHRRLDATRWPDAILGTGWEYGADVAYIRELCAYWRNEYDWRLWEGRLNAYPQFLSQIDDVDIHYWHVKSPVANAYPLLLVHGWP